jgi:hypothetical protein
MKNKILWVVAALLIIMTAAFVANYQKIRTLWLPEGAPAQRPVQK